MSDKSFPIELRPPIGFIVEGHGEYYSYRSIVTQITQHKGFNIPIENARGFGGILTGLDDHLDDIIKSHHPLSIIITIDLYSLITENRFRDCSDLKEHIKGKIENWLDTRSSQTVLCPLPRCIEIVIQIQSLETWLISDISGLNASGMCNIDRRVSWHNVDDEVLNPYEWIKKHSSTPLNTKNPKTVKAIIKFLNVENMRRSSKSFSKFYREVLAKYQYWEAKQTAN